MRVVRLADLDLNLLVTLDALIVEQSARRAAARLGVTQSAVSHALRRLRQSLGDPLLIRTPRGMVPTARAERLAGPLRRWLAELDVTLRDETPFDPRKAQRAFSLSAADATASVVLPALMRHLAAHAPGLELLVYAPAARAFEALESGALDLALGVFPEAPAPYRRQALYKQKFVCLLRQGHPATRRPFTLARYLELSHVSVAPTGTPTNVVDDALAALGHRRHVALVVSHFLVAPAVVAETDLALLVPERIGRHFAARLPLDVLPPPIALEGFTVAQLWHERSHRDPAHAWLRQALVSTSRPARAPAASGPAALSPSPERRLGGRAARAGAAPKPRT